MPRLLTLLLLCLAAACGRAPAGPAPHQVRIVGAAAGLPFAAAIAEDFARAEPRAIVPLVQAGGSAAGIARLCAGTGTRSADIAIVTRPPTEPERARCRGGGLDAMPVAIGWTAAVLVAARDGAPPEPSRAEIHGPAAADDLTTASLGPGAGHGARYHPHGADGDLVARIVAATPGAVGIVPWATALRFADRLRLLPIRGIVPDAATIADGRYPARLPLLLLARPGGTDVAALLRRFAAALAPGGELAGLGLVPLAAPDRAAATAHLRALAGRRATVTNMVQGAR